MGKGPENVYAYGHPCEGLLGMLLTGSGNNIMEKQK